MLDAARLGSSLSITIGLSGVIVITALRGPMRMHPRVEGPIGNVNAMQCVRERGSFEPVRREPSRFVPATQFIAHLHLIERERQHTLRADRRFHLLIRDDLRRTAELAALRHLAAIKDRDRLATLAAD